MPDLKLNTLAQALNMTADVKKQLVFGNYRGYSMYIKVSDYGYCFNYSINIPLSPQNPEDINKIALSLDTLCSENPSITKASYENNKLIINTLSTDKKVSSYQFLISILNKVVEYADTNELIKCCECCGNHASLSNLEFVNINNSVSFRCISCKAGTTPIVTNLEDKSNIPLGIVGALMGSMPGFIFWILLYKLEEIPLGIGAFIGGITVIGIFMGYKFLGTTLDSNGKIISFLLSLIILALAQYINVILHYQFKLQLPLSEIMSNIKFTDIMNRELIAVYLLSILEVSLIYRKFIKNRFSYFN